MCFRCFLISERVTSFILQFQAFLPQTKILFIFFHTKSYCNHSLRCVLSEGTRFTDNSPKLKTKSPNFTYVQ